MMGQKELANAVKLISQRETWAQYTSFQIPSHINGTHEMSLKT